MRGGPAHGPYWYGYFYEHGKLRCIYIGKELPSEHSKPEQRDSEAVDRWTIPRRWSDSTALRVLGVATRSEAPSAYRKLVLRFHPDRVRGKDKDIAERAIRAINGAWGFLR